MSAREILLIICSIGAIQSIFIGLIFIVINKKNNRTNLVLELLLIALGIRVAKSTLYLFATDIDDLILNIGFAAHAAVAPLLFLYSKHFNKSPLRKRKLGIHLIPAGLLLMFSFFLTTDNFWYRGGYSVLLYYTMVYLSLTLHQLWVRWSDLEKVEKRWLVELTSGVGVFLVAYFTNFILGITAYVLAPILYALVIYILSYFVLINYKWFKDKDTGKKYRYVNLTKDQINDYVRSIEAVFSDPSKPFLSNEFTLNSLSESTKIPNYVLSHVFSEYLKTKFTDYLNKYRIRDARERITDEKYANYKISAIAYDCGFNSLSSFNVAFKKETGKTPSSYRTRTPEA